MFFIFNTLATVYFNNIRVRDKHILLIRLAIPLYTAVAVPLHDNGFTLVFDFWPFFGAPAKPCVWKNFQSGR